MKILNNNIFKVSFALFMFVVTSCDITDLEVEDSPNALRTDQAELDLYISSASINLASFFEGGNEFGMDVTRMLNMAGPLYFNAYVPQSFDVTWSRAYATVLQDLETAIPEAEGLEFYYHAGIAKIMKAYVYMVLVDMWGDVPYSEANLGEANINPQTESGSVIYADMVALLDEAIDNIAQGSQLPTTGDIYYGESGGNGTFENSEDVDSAGDWIRLANTLKMRAALNQGDGAAFTAAIADTLGVLVEDWSFQYGTSISNPDARHPQYANNYDNGGSDYMSNYFMNVLLNDKAAADPRIRYYFYRQETTESTDVNEINCINRIRPTHYAASDPYCQIGSGYWGRDHGDDDGIPPDNALRTIWGVYPVGGRYDNSDDTDVDNADGALGGGISPLMLDFYVDFMRAEAALTLGTGEDARAFMEAGIRGSMDKVLNFGASIGYPTDGFGSAASATDVDDYVNEVLANYDAAATDEERLAVTSREYYIALWGNGYETYNLYRRTSYPDDMQPTLEEDPGDFIRTFFYPANLVQRNQNVDQKELTVRTFWDTNPDVLK